MKPRGPIVAIAGLKWRRGRLEVMIEDLYRLVSAAPESEWTDVERDLEIKAMPTEVPTDKEIGANR